MFSRGEHPICNIKGTICNQNHLSSATMDGVEGVKNFWGLPCHRAHSAPVPTRAFTFCLFLGDQNIVSSAWDRQSPLMDLTGRQSWPASCTWGIRGSVTRKALLEQGVQEECKGQMAQVWKIAQVLRFSTGQPGEHWVVGLCVQAAMKSNHLLSVYFHWTLIAIVRLWSPFGFSSSLSLSGLSRCWYPFPGFFSLPRISNESPNIINILSHNWAQHGYQCPIPGPGSIEENLSFLLWMWPIRTFSDRALFLTKLPKDLLYLLYRFPGSSIDCTGGRWDRALGTSYCPS